MTDNELVELVDRELSDRLARGDQGSTKLAERLARAIDVYFDGRIETADDERRRLNGPDR